MYFVFLTLICLFEMNEIEIEYFEQPVDRASLDAPLRRYRSRLPDVPHLFPQQLAKNHQSVSSAPAIVLIYTTLT